MTRFGLIVVVATAHALALGSAPAAAQSLIPIANAGFESGVLGQAPSGWTVSAGAMYLTTGLSTEGDPAGPFAGSRFVAATWQAVGVASSPFPVGQAMSMYQDIDLSGFASTVDSGDRAVNLSFAYNAADANDLGVVGLSFFGGDSSLLGQASFSTAGAGTGNKAWGSRSLERAVPAGTRSMRVSLSAERVAGGGGSARNISYDSLVANLVEYVPPPPDDIVHGNMIMLQENGGWCWYQDERALVDSANGSLLFTSVGNYLGYGGESRDGSIDVNSFDPATGRRSRTQLAVNPSFDTGDDHNVGAVWKRPDGRYLVMHKGHNEGAGWNGVPTGSDVLPKSYYRISTNPHDASSWGPQQEFVWPENDTTSPINNDVTYANLHYLAEEGAGQGRLYNISRGPDRTPGVIYSDNLGETWTYGGKLSITGGSSQQGQYSNGYFKYSSNGTDRIDFIATEHHPRNFNNSIFHGYIQGGKSYDAQGNVIDENIFDLTAPAPAAFTPVWTTSAVTSTSYHHAWTAELERDDAGNLYGLITSRYGTQTVDGQTGDGDHRLFYVRFDALNQSWSSTELSKMGGPLHNGEQDYTGLGAIDPNDPNTVVISTPFDPRDDSPFEHHEIFKGVTADNGATWTWTPLTENSTVDNLRPVIPHRSGSDRPILWLRGAYPNQRRYDQSVVGVIERAAQKVGLVQYVDATLANTSLADDSPLVVATGGVGDVVDGRWHDVQGVGNGGGLLSSNAVGAENAPTIKTTTTPLKKGSYDIFVFFWADPNADWRISAGLSESEMVVFQQDASQHALPEHFNGTVEVVSAQGSQLLYRGYVGRVELTGLASIDVYVDDISGGSALRTWYDGVGYSRIDRVLPGDFNNDGVVDAADYTVWRDHLGATSEAALAAGSGTGDGLIDQADYELWRQSFATTGAVASGFASLYRVPEPASIAFCLASAVSALRRPPGW